jgi:hypothetical protein
MKRSRFAEQDALKLKIYQGSKIAERQKFEAKKYDLLRLLDKAQFH